jgi:hypothetical protein
MNAALQDPVFKDVAELEQALHDDQSGDRARAMMGYFEQAALASEAMARAPCRHSGSSRARPGRRPARIETHRCARVAVDAPRALPT